MMGTFNCVYETPCGWCSKWDKKCDKKAGTHNKLITTNGKWEVIRFYHDGAFYSYCTECSYMHPCYKHRENFFIEHAPEKEFNYCPMCGMKMLEDS